MKKYSFQCCLLVLTGILFTDNTFAVSVSEMVDLALSNDQRFLQAQSRLRISEFGEDAANAPLKPQVRIDAQHRFANQIREHSDSYNDTLASVSIRQTLYDKSKFSKSDTSNLQQTLAEAGVERATQSSLQNLSLLYLEYVSHKEQLGLLNSQLEQLRATLDIEEEKFAANASSVVNLSRVRADYYQALSLVITQEGNVESANDALDSLFGSHIPVPNTKASEDLILEIPKGNEQSWVEDALQNNHDIRSAVIDASIQQEMLDGSRSGYYPTISAIGNYSWSDNLNNSDMINEQAYIGIELSWPIYGGGITDSISQQQVEVYRNAQLEIDYQQKNVADRVRYYWRTLASLMSSIEANALSVQAAFQAYEAIRIRFESGAIAQEQLLDSRQRYFNSKVLLSNSRYLFMKTYISLYFVSGALEKDTFVKIVSNWIELDD